MNTLSLSRTRTLRQELAPDELAEAVSEALDSRDFRRAQTLARFLGAKGWALEAFGDTSHGWRLIHRDPERTQ